MGVCRKRVSKKIEAIVLYRFAFMDRLKFMSAGKGLSGNLLLGALIFKVMKFCYSLP